MALVSQGGIVPAKKTTGKKATGKAATGKAATGKAATGKAATGKKATGKAATGKKATGKKAAAKRATATRATARKAPTKEPAIRPRRGDLIVIDSAQVGSPSREGEVLKVIHGEVGVSYRVKWTDGHETLIAPTAGSVTIVRS